MKILVTGATGLIGSHLTQALVKEGCLVRAFVQPTCQMISRLNGLDVEIVSGDIRDAEEVEKAVKGCDQIFHLAAQLSVGRAKADIYAVNVEGTRNTARAAVKFGVERFVQGSSVGIYGLMKHPPMDETTRPRPNSHYRKTKWLGEQIVLDYHRQAGLPVVIARIGSVTGARAYEWSGLLNTIATQQFSLIGTGNNYYHTVDVADLVDGLILCARTKNIEGESYILADRDPVRIKHLLQLLAAELGVGTIRQGSPLAPFKVFQAIAETCYHMTGIQLPHAQRYDLFLTNRVLSITKAQAQLGYAPKVPLQESIQSLVSWYRDGMRT